MKTLKTLEIDTEKRIYRVNGTDISEANFFSLQFRDGCWSLMIAEDKSYLEYHNKLIELTEADSINKMIEDFKKELEDRKKEGMSDTSGKCGQHAD